MKYEFVRNMTKLLENYLIIDTVQLDVMEVYSPQKKKRNMIQEKKQDL